MDDYWRDFVQESEEHITELNNSLLALERSPANDDAMEAIFRSAHTLKGNCGAMGLTRASDLAHAIEDLLEAVRSDEVDVTSDLMDTIFDGVDELEAMIDEVATHGEIKTDPAPTIDALRTPLDEDDREWGTISSPTDDEIDATLARFDPPADEDHDAYLVRISINDVEGVNNGVLVVDALIDAFDLIGTDPSREAIENESYGGSFDAVFGTAVGKTAITSALEPVDAVSSFEIVSVTDRFEALDSSSSAAESDDTDAAGVDDASDAAAEDISPDRAQDLSVDELLDEFTEFDDLDAMVDEVDDVSAFDEMGEAGSFHDLLEDDVDIDPTAGSSDADSDADTDGVAGADTDSEATAADEQSTAGDSVSEGADGDDDEVDDAGAVFNELKQEVEMVGFDELQNELDELEFDEFDSDDEVDMDELLGDDVDVADNSFLNVSEAELEAEVDEMLADADVDSGSESESESESEAEPESETDLEAQPNPEMDVSTGSDSSFASELDSDDITTDDDIVADDDTFEAFSFDDATPEDDDAAVTADTADETLTEDLSALDSVDFGDADDSLVDDGTGTLDESSADESTAGDEEPTDGLDDSVATGDSESADSDADSLAADADALESELESETNIDATNGDADDDIGLGTATDDGSALEAQSETASKSESESDLETESEPDVDSDVTTDADDPVDTVDEGVTAERSDVGDDAGLELESAGDDIDGDGDDTDDFGDVSTDDSDSFPTDDPVAAESLEDEAGSFDDTSAVTSDADADGAVDADGVTAPASADEDSGFGGSDDGVSDEFDDFGSESAVDEFGVDDVDDVDEYDYDDDFDYDQEPSSSDFTTPTTEFDPRGGGSVESENVDAGDAFGDADGLEAESDAADSVDDEAGSETETGSRIKTEPDNGGLNGMEIPDITIPETPDRPQTDDGSDEIQTVRVDVDQIDSLLNLVEGLVTSRVRLRHAIESGEELKTIDKELDDLEDLTAELQETVMDVRLVPLQTVASRLPRVVRDIARDQNKEVVFERTGDDVELDRSILDRIGDPLTHLVRNAVDHGIEPPAEREAAGKPREGTVELRTTQSRDRVTIEIEDDGSGLDPDQLRSAAVEADVLTEAEAEDLDDDDALELVFHSGLTTATEVTDVSGRGVGMDVVKRTVDALDGSVSVDSEAGEGTTVSMGLPVTVAIADVLFVESGGEEFGIPTKVVQDIEDAHAVETVDGQQVLVDEGTDDELPVIDLADALQTPGASANGDGMVVRIRDDVRPLGVHCSEVRGQQEVVIKPFEGFMSDIPGLSGATVRGRGEVVNILDVNTL